jgi:pyrophosphatase PpaX
MMRCSVVLFDLDGTLVDSGPILLASMRHATKTVLDREFADDELLAHVGGWGLHEQMRVFDAARAEELVQCYREHNEPLHAELAWCTGMKPVLDRLAEQGRTLGLVTTKRRRTVELAFAALPLERYFDVFVASDDTRRHKPHPEPLLLALERLGRAPEEAAYVGDAPFDVEAAKAGGLLAVAVTWGGIHSRERLEAAEPDAIVSKPEGLLGVL